MNERLKLYQDSSIYVFDRQKLQKELFGGSFSVEINGVNGFIHKKNIGLISSENEIEEKNKGTEEKNKKPKNKKKKSNH